MKNILENISAYAECFVRNVFTLNILVFVFLGIFLIFTKENITAYVFFSLAAISFYFTNFGLSSYKMYQKSLEIFFLYQKGIDNVNVYCWRVGYNVALRRFKKRCPGKYKIMLHNNHYSLRV